MHNHVLKAVQKHNTEAFMDKLTHIAGRCLTRRYSYRVRSADLDNVEGLQGNDCQLKKWYREWQRTSDERRTVRRMVEKLATFELSMSRLYVCYGEIEITVSALHRRTYVRIYRKFARRLHD